MNKSGALSVLFLSLFLCPLLSAESVSADQGILDLSGESLEAGETALDGRWFFHWGKLLPPEMALSGETFAYVPGNWALEGGDSAWGFATLGLRVTGLEPQKSYSLYVPEMLTAYRLYIDGVYSGGNGTVGTSPESHSPGAFPRVVTFTAEESAVQIVLHVSNYNYRKGGLWRSIRLGSPEVVSRGYESSLLYEVLIAAVLLAIGLYHLGFFVFRSQEKTALFFGLACLGLVIRILCTGEQLMTYLVPAFPWELARRLEYSPFYFTAPMVICFINHLFEIKDRGILRGFQIFYGICAGFYLFVPVAVSNRTILGAEAAVLVSLIYVLTMVVLALVRHKEGSIGFLFSFLFLGAAIVNDILYAGQIISSFYMAPLGFIIFIFMQSQILSRKFARSFSRIETLTGDLQELNNSLSRFVPFQFLEYLKRKSILEVELGDQVQENMTILFADIRSFTSLSEEMTPEANFKFLNDFLSRVVPVIRENGGFIDKFIGDAVMALFPSPPDQAVRAAVEIQRQVDVFNNKRPPSDDPILPVQKISMGIGLHTGNLMLGTIGESSRMETTVISDTVNVASRLEGLTKQFGARILISRDLYQKLETSKEFMFRSLGAVPVKGKSQPLGVLEVLDCYEEEKLKKCLESRRWFHNGLKAFSLGDYPAAQVQFQEVLDLHDGDKAAEYYWNMSRRQFLKE